MKFFFLRIAQYKGFTFAFIGQSEEKKILPLLARNGPKAEKKFFHRIAISLILDAFVCSRSQKNIFSLFTFQKRRFQAIFFLKKLSDCYEFFFLQIAQYKGFTYAFIGQSEEKQNSPHLARYGPKAEKFVFHHVAISLIPDAFVY